MNENKEFNLRETGFDNILGSIIEIQDTKYRLHSIVGEGGEKIVVSLQNVETDLVQFVIRIYKCKEGSDLYYRIKEFLFGNAGCLHHLNFTYRKEDTYPELEDKILENINEIRLEGISRMITLDKIAEDNIPYWGNQSERVDAIGVIDNFMPMEIGGALIQFQDVFDPFKFESNFAEKIMFAYAYFNARDFKKAHEYCDDILKSNPKHTDAIHIKSLLAFAEGNWIYAEKLLAINLLLEPNYNNYYINYATILRKMDKPNFACLLLGAKLKFYKFQPFIFNQLMETILTFDYIEKFAESYNEYAANWKSTDDDYGRFLNFLYIKSLHRFIKFREHFDKALTLQIKNNWKEAISEYNLSTTDFRRKSLVIYNLALCNFRIGEFKICIDVLRNEYRMENQPELKYYYYLFTALSYTSLGEFKFSLGYFKEMYYEFNNLNKFPGVPMAFELSDKGLNPVEYENKKNDEIIIALDSIDSYFSFSEKETIDLIKMKL